MRGEKRGERGERVEQRREEYLKLLRETELFDGLAEEEILQVIAAPGAVVQKFGKEQFIYREGQKNAKAAIVLEGRVHIMKEDFWGNRSILAEAGGGELSFANESGTPCSAPVLRTGAPLRRNLLRKLPAAFPKSPLP